MKVLLAIASDRFMDEAYTIPKAALEAAGVECVTAAPVKGTCYGMHGEIVEADAAFKDINADEFDGIIIGGSNYGQGSSREHAALVPMYLGIRGVVAKSFARIHIANLINSGILPMTFANPDDYDLINQDDTLIIRNIFQHFMIYF